MGDVTYINPRGKEIEGTTDNLSDVIHCLMISLLDETILLPNAAVAEVIGFITPKPLDGSPNWFLGQISWRDSVVPLISFENASRSDSDEAESVQQGKRIAILNTLKGNTASPYIGIVVQGIPRLSVIRNDIIKSVELMPGNRQSVSEIVDIDGQQLVIPDIDDLEIRLNNVYA